MMITWIDDDNANWHPNPKLNACILYYDFGCNGCNNFFSAWQEDVVVILTEQYNEERNTIDLNSDLIAICGDFVVQIIK